MRAAPADRTQTTSTSYLICAVAWFVPGAGHLWLGRRQKGLVFLVAITLMFAFGLWLEGRLFPFEMTQPLVALMALADIGVGLPYFIARALGIGAGQVVAITLRVRQYLHHRRRPVEHAGRPRCVRHREGA